MIATLRSRPPGASTSARFQAYRTDDPGLGKYLMQQLIDSLKQTIPDGLDVKPRVLWRLVYLVPAVAGCDCFWLFWLTSGAQAASCSAGGTHADGGVWSDGAVPVHPLGGGEHGRRQCPPKAPGHGSARPCTRSSEPRPEQSRKESPFDPTEATASHSDRACP